MTVYGHYKEHACGCRCGVRGRARQANATHLVLTILGPWCGPAGKAAWVVGLCVVLMISGGLARADLLVNSLTQTPANVVAVDKAVTYDLIVSTDARTQEFVAIDIRDASGSPIDDSQMQSNGCSWDGLWFCSFVAPGQPVTYQFTWTPPAGTHDLSFDVQCNAPCQGSAARIRTVVGNPPVAVDDVGEAQTGVAALIPVLANDSDPQQLPLVLDAVLSPPSNGSAALARDGISYTANTGFIGIDRFVYQVRNANGSTATATVTVSVFASLTTEARDDSAQTGEETAVVIDVLNNDVGARGSPIAVVSTTTPARGAVAINNDNTLTYTPAAGFVGNDSFQYTMGVVDDLDQRATATVNITVLGRETPIAGNDVAEATSGNSITVDVLANDVGSNGSSVSVKSVSEAQNGQVEVDLSLGVIRYTPNAGFSGQDQFSYTMIDGNEQEATGTVTVSVSASQDVPAPTATTNLASLSGLTANQRAYATVMDQACASVTSGDLSARCAALAGMSDSDKGSAVNQLTPNQLHAMGTESVEATVTQLTNVKARVLELRGGGLGLLSLSQLRLAINGGTLPLGSLLQATVHQADDNSDAPLTPGPRFGVFVNGRINIGDKDSTSRETGFDFSTHDLTLGMDYRFNDRLFLGGALGYTTGEADFDANAGELDSQSTSFSVYGSYFQSERFYLDWIVNLAASDYELDRHIVFGGVNTTATGNPDGQQYGIALNVGSDFSLGGFLLSPYARIEYIEAEVDAYAESGGSGFALSVDEQTIRSLTTALALRLSKAYSMRWGVLVPAAHAEWEHEYKDNRRSINARFVDVPSAGTFTITTDDPDRDYFNVGANVSAVMERGRAFFLSYEALLGQSHVTNSTIELGFRMEF